MFSTVLFCVTQHSTNEILSLLSIPAVHVAVAAEVLVTGVGSSGTEVAVAFPAVV